MTEAFHIDEPAPPQTESISQRWGEAVSAGFIPVPNALMRAQAKLGLTPTELVVLLNLLLHWWSSDRHPFPSTPAIAKRSGLTARTVQRNLKSLEQKKLISRERARPQLNAKGEMRNARAHYNLSGLREKLSQFAVQDVWYRPTVVKTASAGTEAKGQERRPNA